MDRRLSMSIDTELNPSDNYIPQRSVSLDPSTTDFSDSLQLRRQSVDTSDNDLSSLLGIQRPSVILSKVKSLASTQQEKTGRKVKELFSSLSPTPSSSSVQTLTSTYSTTPLASAVPPTVGEVSIGVTSPSPEIGLLPTYVGYEDYDGVISGPQSHEMSSPILDMDTERFVAFTTEAM